jgi:hypothetical protein
MRDFLTIFVPLGVIVFLIVYFFLIDPSALHGIRSNWLQVPDLGRSWQRLPLSLH